MPSAHDEYDEATERVTTPEPASLDQDLGLDNGDLGAADLQQASEEQSDARVVGRRSTLTPPRNGQAGDHRRLLLAEYREGLRTLRALDVGSDTHSQLRRHLEALEREILASDGAPAEKPLTD